MWIIQQTEPYIVTDSKEIPYNDVTLVLGTSKWVVRGRPNRYYAQRIAVTAEIGRAACRGRGVWGVGCRGGARGRKQQKGK